MRKTLFSALAVFLFAASAAGAECRKHVQSYVGADERGEPFLLKNRSTGYVLTFRYINPSPTQTPEVLIGMPLPVNLTGFSRRDFVHFQVNGIDSRKLEPKKYEIFNRGETAGVDILYNFNGLGFRMRFSVSDASPLLTLSLLREPGTPAEAIQKLRIDFNVLPCASARKSHSYAREIVSPNHHYRGRPGVRRQQQKLTVKDTVLILQDARYQAGAEPRNASPVLLVPDWKIILSGIAVFGTHQNLNLSFKLDPKAERWDFGLLESEAKRNNAQFLQFIRSDLGLF